MKQEQDEVCNKIQAFGPVSCARAYDSLAAKAAHFQILLLDLNLQRVLLSSYIV